MVREAGALARTLMAQPLEIQSKGPLGPVTNVDYAVDALLAEKLLGARPEYGWLSEETPDELERRANKARVFVVDPVDGTAAMIARVPQWAVSVGIVENGRAVAGAVYNPMTDEFFLGAVDEGATLNRRPMRASLREKLEDARMIGQKIRFSDSTWPAPWPKMEIIERQSIAYRLALVASGQGDATVLFGFKNEWDIAAGAALVEAAGGRVSDPWGEVLSFNQAIPRAPGVVAAGADLHALLIERTKALPDPRKN